MYRHFAFSVYDSTAVPADHKIVTSPPGFTVAVAVKEQVHPFASLRCSNLLPALHHKPNAIPVARHLGTQNVIATRAVPVIIESA